MKKEQNNIEKIVTGKVTYAGFGQTSKDKTDKFRLTFESNNLDKSDFKECFKNSELKPKFVTDEKCNIINLKSLFDFPCVIRDENCNADIKDRVESFSDWLDTKEIVDAEIKVKIKLKDGAMYPVALAVLKMGSIYNPFEGL